MTMFRFRGLRALPRGAAWGWVLSVVVAAGTLLPAASVAQQGWIQSNLTNEEGQPLSAVTVQVTGTSIGSLTDDQGRARLGPLAPGNYEVRAARLGYRTQTQRIAVGPNETAVASFTLALAPVELSGIQVSVLRPDLRPEVGMHEHELREANPHDIGMVMRTLPGLDAVRRGALGMDPVVRGLRDTQVGAYVDGMRTMPGGPAGMDSPLSHVDPSAVHGLEVVKGPYALTWGAGNMSAIRLDTHPLPTFGGTTVGGSSFAGYDSNLGATEAGATLFGTRDRVAFTASGALRSGSDYTTGSGAVVPSGFTSGEVRGRIGVLTSPVSQLSVSGWYQNQKDIDYPGRPLDADWFETVNGAIGWKHAPAAGLLHAVDLQAYYYRVDHGMDNDDKPTALANPDRTPPFPLDIRTVTGVDMLGARASTELKPLSGWTLQIGGDLYTADHNGHRETIRRDSGMEMPASLIWGGARITDLGLYTRAERHFGRATASGTVRLDLVDARADSASAFFLENVSSDLEAKEANLSGAFTVTLPLGGHWSISGGAGSVVRTAEANERYSDRAPAKKAQIGAEFIGDPQIRPERSTQIDLWLEGGFPGVAVSANVFTRWMSDHITLEETTLPRQSPMSAPMVFRYVNGDATYRGAEATALVDLTRGFTLGAAAAYLYGQDTTLDEPALGVTPLWANASLRWQPAADEHFVDLAVTAAGRQDRVSTTRGEQPTAGYATIDLQGGVPLPGGLFLRAGVNNLLDRDYVNHLNARNPFTGIALAEPGRVLFTRLSVRF
jgi:iron complex outermembrane recepter protein